MALLFMVAPVARLERADEFGTHRRDWPVTLPVQRVAYAPRRRLDPIRFVVIGFASSTLAANLHRYLLHPLAAAVLAHGIGVRCWQSLQTGSASVRMGMARPNLTQQRGQHPAMTSGAVCGLGYASHSGHQSASPSELWSGIGEHLSNQGAHLVTHHAGQNAGEFRSNHGLHFGF